MTRWTMCHHHEARALAALREELAETDADEAADDADLLGEPPADAVEADAGGRRLPPIQPSD